MKVIILILACERDRERMRLQRDTWLRACSIDYKFVLGREARVQQRDELIVMVPDAGHQAELTLKWQLAVCEVYTLDYDYIFRCETDTYVNVPRLLASGFEKHDYVGNRGPCPSQNSDKWAIFGGPGFWISHRAMEAIIAADPAGDCSNCDDWWTWAVLKKAGIEPHHDARYSDTDVVPASNNALITSHRGDQQPMPSDIYFQRAAIVRAAYEALR